MRSWAARDWGYWGCLFGLAPKQQILGGPIGLQIGAGLGLDGKPRDKSGPLTQSRQPARHMRFVIKRLLLTVPKPGPRPNGNIGDR